MKFLISIALVLCAASVSFASKESTFKNKTITIVPTKNSVLTGYVYELSDNFYFVKNMDRIFFQTVPIDGKIVDVDIDDNEAKFKICNDKYGCGTIKIYSDNDLEDAPDSLIEKALFNSISNEVLQKFILDTSTRRIHTVSCNHLPENTHCEIVGNEALLNKTNKICGVCFEKQLYIADIQTELEIQNKLLAELRHYNEKLIDADLQTKVDTVADRILKAWPYPLVGYEYKFLVIESKEINAYALPAGIICVTTGLIKSLENDAELEAVLAHEIAHVERRHSLQTYKEMVSDQQARMALQMVGGIAMGVAAARNNNNVAGVIGGVTLASMVAIQIKEIGFKIGHEKEADEYAVRYFRFNNKDLRPLKSVLRKLMYHNLRVRNNPDPKNTSHPLLRSRLAEIDKKSVTFMKDTAYYSIRYDVPLELKFYSCDTDDIETKIVFEVSDLSAFESIERSKEFSFVNDVGEIKCEVLNTLFTNPWGGVVTVSTKSKNLNFSNLTALRFQSIPNPNHRDYYVDTIERKLTKGFYY